MFSRTLVQLQLLDIGLPDHTYLRRMHTTHLVECGYATSADVAEEFGCYEQDVLDRCKLAKIRVIVLYDSCFVHPLVVSSIRNQIADDCAKSLERMAASTAVSDKQARAAPAIAYSSKAPPVYVSANAPMSKRDTDLDTDLEKMKEMVRRMGVGSR